MTCPRETLGKIQENWLSGHLYYHQNLNPVVQGFVHPLVVSLVKGAQIDAFFFLRYGLGGSHVRLRLRVTPSAKERVLDTMQQSAKDFLELSPSPRSADEEVIRRTTQLILAGDRTETDDSIYPNNSFRVAPFCPEVERYGGSSLLQASLDFFALSSVAVIEFLSKYSAASRSAQLAHAFRLLLKQALGFAADETELSDLLRYGVDMWGNALPRVVEKGDAVAHSHMNDFLQLFLKSLTEVRSLCAESGSFGEASDILVVGASSLSAAIGTTNRVTRARIGGSQLHMTATRLGLSNAEEVYISRLLHVTLRELRAISEEDFSWLNKKIKDGVVKAPEESLRDLLSPAFAILADIPLNPGTPSI